MKVCKKCGAQYEGEQKFCKKCGALLEEMKAEKETETEIKPKKKSKTRLYILTGVLVVALIGGAAVTMKVMQDKKQEERETKEEERRENESEEEREEKEREEREKDKKKEKDEKEKEEKEKEKETEKESEEEKAAREKEELEKQEAEEQAELLKKYEEQERREAEIDTQMKQVLNADEVENEVLRIRKIFTEDIEKSNAGTYEKRELAGGYNAWFGDGQLKMINTTAEATTSSYERIFIYEEGKLIFAYLKEEGNESRLYYKDDNIFRWSYPETTQIMDNDFDNPEFVQNGIEGRSLGYELYKQATE